MTSAKRIMEIARSLQRMEQSIDATGNGCSLCRLDASWLRACLDLLAEVAAERQKNAANAKA